MKRGDTDRHELIHLASRISHLALSLRPSPFPRIFPRASLVIFSMHTPIEFNPAMPLPRNTLGDVMATGVGRAEWGRLYYATVGGTFGALLVLLLIPSWWLASTPLICIASFAGWGLAAQKSLQLDRKQIRAPSLRLTLQLMRTIAMGTCALSALAGLFGTLALLMQRS